MTSRIGAQKLQQTLAGLLFALALYLLAWNEVPSEPHGSLLSLLGTWLHPALAIPDARIGVRVVAGLLALASSVYCIAGMGNTLGLIPLFGGRIALSARLAGGVLGTLLGAAAALLGAYSRDLSIAALLVTPLASVLLLLLWRSRRDDAPLADRRAANHAPPVLLDLPGNPSASVKTPRQEPQLPALPTTTASNKPATFTARAPRQADGSADLSPLDFDGGLRAGSGRGKTSGGMGIDLGLPPLEFTPSTPAPAPAMPPRPAFVAKASAAPPPRRIEDGLPPLDFPAPAPLPPAAAPPAPPAPTPAPVNPLQTLDTLDFSPPPRSGMAPLADELANWSPRPSAGASAPSMATENRRKDMPGVAVASGPTPIKPPAAGGRATPNKPAASAAPPAAPPAVPRRPTADLLDELPLGEQAFTLDTVAPREVGPRRALLDEEPDLLSQLGALSQVQTPPASPVTAPVRPPAVSPPIIATPVAPQPPPKPATQRVKLADKGSFTIYKLLEGGEVVGYALTERGINVAIGTQEQIKQALRERWHGQSS